MATLPLAFSVHHFIDSVGADAGFAAIIGLAILILLYFAQARETATLREQAQDAAQRVAQLEGRLAFLTRQQTVRTPPGPVPSPLRPSPTVVAAVSAVPARAPAPATAYAGAVAAPPPGPPAGVAGPSLAAATRLIPTVGGPDAQPAAAYARVPADGAGATTAAAAGIGVLPPAPATAAGGANGGRADTVPAPVPADGPSPLPADGASPVPADGASPVPADGPSPVPADGPSPIPADGPAPIPADGPAPAGAPHGPILPPPGDSEVRRSRTGRFLAALLVVLAAAAVVGGLLIITSNGSNTTSGSSAAGNAAGHNTRHVVAFRPSTVTVAVLNGTGTSGLARRIATRLGTAGYKQGTVANAADQTNSTTIVAYLPGHRTDALRVASSLKLRPGAVQPVDASTQQVACPPPTSCTADVVVTVGADLASQ